MHLVVVVSYMKLLKQLGNCVNIRVKNHNCMLVAHILIYLGNWTHSIDHSSEVDALTQKFDQLLCTNEVSNAPSMQDVCLIYASLMQAFIDHRCVSKFDCVTK